MQLNSQPFNVERFGPTPLYTESLKVDQVVPTKYMVSKISRSLNSIFDTHDYLKVREYKATELSPEEKEKYQQVLLLGVQYFLKELIGTDSSISSNYVKFEDENDYEEETITIHSYEDIIRSETYKKAIKRLDGKSILSGDYNAIQDKLSISNLKALFFMLKLNAIKLNERIKIMQAESIAIPSTLDKRIINNEDEGGISYTYTSIDDQIYNNNGGIKSNELVADIHGNEVEIGSMMQK